jgi:ATP-dependent Lhr-like helicase
VFTSPPLFAVRHGRQELGFVDEMTFLGQKEGPRVLLLGGMAWRVNHIDWRHRVAYVEATEAKGRSRWKGDRPGLGFRVCQSIKHLLAGDEDGATWSRRTRQQIHDIRQTYIWLDAHSTVVVRDQNEPAEWWTFAGTGANAALAHELSQATQSAVDHDSFTLTFESHVSRQTIEQALRELRAGDVSRMRVAVDDQAMEGLKFSACLPHELALDMLQNRIRDPVSLQWVLKQPVKGFIYI